MHRWFFANEKEECEPRDDDDGSKKSQEEEAPPTPPPIRTTDWPFCVKFHRPLNGNEYVAISGNCESLGNWDPKKLYVLEKYTCFDCICNCYQFEATVTIPRNIDIEYRYCVVIYDPKSKEMYIRFWEAQLKPRIIKTYFNMLKKCDNFGTPHEEDENNRIDRGWATTETIVHLKFFNAPFCWQRQKQRLLYVHIQPMFELQQDSCLQPSLPVQKGGSTTRLSRYLESRNSKIDDIDLQLAQVEVVNLRAPKPLGFQPDFGVRCGREDLQLFHCSIASPLETLYRIDLYTYAYKAAPDEPPYIYGYGFLMPDQLQGTEGCARVKIACGSTHRPLMELWVRYLIIKPLENFHCDLSRSYERYWRTGQLCMNIGHKGSGNTYRLKSDLVREHTLYGFKQAALANADMVEFDVHLTQDAQVVVHHDFVLRFLLQRMPSYDELLEKQDLLVFPYEKLNRLMLLSMGGCKRKDTIAVPLESFTYEQLKDVKVLRFTGSKGCDVSCDRMVEDQRPFPLLLDLLQEEVLPTSMGFLIEVKWPQLTNCRRWESGSFKPTFDRNFYVDTILELVLQNAGKRRIVFSSFDADICAMIRYKQNIYPVTLLLEDPESPIQYCDQRVNVLETAVNLSNSLEFLGLSLHANSILNKPGTMALLHLYGLKAFVYGSSTSSLDTRNILKRHGPMGIIYDRLDQLDQAGEELEGDTICTIDSVTTRPVIRETELEEWRQKCGYKEESVIAVKNIYID
ncbi:glycerophosphocholine phosphodiesterase GPCPD1 [Drosophila ficusphila]|uniref:glycerophosphocholine phosphodiesterase GPCPD1 n=1 Tax=Drosophila ficusphila TaxID=30025 RepID=UPI0007E78C20|nr:glycerophosphocholine phosphodiesterase GPCPD1 [Drosophila ficusphila]